MNTYFTGTGVKFYDDSNEFIAVVVSSDSISEVAEGAVKIKEAADTIHPLNYIYLFGSFSTPVLSPGVAGIIQRRKFDLSLSKQILKFVRVAEKMGSERVATCLRAPNEVGAELLKWAATWDSYLLWCRDLLSSQDIDGILEGLCVDPKRSIACLIGSHSDKRLVARVYIHESNHLFFLFSSRDKFVKEITFRMKSSGQCSFVANYWELE